MSLEVIEIYKGDSTDITTVSIKGVTDYTDYKGILEVVDAEGGTPVISRIIAPEITVGVKFMLTPDESDSIPVGKYIMTYQISKVETGVVTMRKEIRYVLYVKAQAVTTVEV